MSAGAVVATQGHLRIVSQESLKRQQREDGLTFERAEFTMPLKRLITTADGVKSIERKVYLDVNEGRLDIPLLYLPLYRSLKDDNLPRNIDTNLVSQFDVVFLQRWEGGDVKYGHISAGSNGTVPIASYSAGFEWTKENEMYEETWAISEFNLAFGRAYNALLNHLHLDAIISATYSSGNLTAAATGGADIVMNTRQTIINALRTAALARRPCTAILCSTADSYQVQDALLRRTDNSGNSLPAIAEIDTIILYDGETITVGDRTYTYGGVPAGTIFLVRPRVKLVEIVKTQGGQDLFTEIGNGDPSRRIAEQLYAHTYRGLYADTAGSVQKATLPTS